MGPEMLHEPRATTSPCGALPDPGVSTGGRRPCASTGGAVLRQDPAPRERRLWNDTITPAERAAREPSGMSCLSKALSAPLRAPPGPHSEHRSPFPLLQGAAQGRRCHVLGPPWCSGDGDRQNQPQPCSTGPIERLRGGDISPAWVCPPPAAEQGVLGSSCPADSQQLVWCEQRFSDHLLAVGGAGSTPARGLPGGGCPHGGAVSPTSSFGFAGPTKELPGS